MEGKLLQRQPELENGTKPDFLVEDDEGNRCYVEAKVRLNSAEEDRYFDDWIVGKLMDHKSVDGKGIGVHGVSGIPESEPALGSLLQEIYDWLGTFSSGDLEELKERDLRSKVFSLSGHRNRACSNPRQRHREPVHLRKPQQRRHNQKAHESTWLSGKSPPTQPRNTRLNC